MPDMFDDPYEGDDDRKNHILRQNERMDDSRRFKKKYKRHVRWDQDKRTKRFKQKPVDPRIAALDEYSVGELRAALARKLANERTPEQKAAIEAKRRETIARKQAACDHTAKEPRRVKKRGKTRGKLQCPDCYAILDEKYGAKLRTVT